ncbi:MAG: type II toxin-antitoxin system HicA family toxin [Dehalococcoidia bacterium]|nr:type II toxin-antitoxin system HicA family toxin [Dehalococcoidia bacterium]
MPALPTLKGREVLRALLKGGFYIHHQRGSHARLFHQSRSELRVTIPTHNKDLPEKTLRGILKQADLTEEEFLDLLRG